MGTAIEQLIGLFVSSEVRRRLWRQLKKSVNELRGYLDENSFLFTLIGVFGAISVYSVEIIERTGQSKTFIGETATVAGFSLVVLLSLVAILDLWARISNNRPIFAIENTFLLIFGSFFGPLVYIVIGVLTQFPEIWRIYYLGVAYLIGIFAPMGILSFITDMSRRGAERFGLPNSFKHFAQFVFGVVGIVIIDNMNGIVGDELIEQEALTTQFAIESLTVFLMFGLVIAVLIALLSGSLGILTYTSNILKQSWEKAIENFN